MIFDTVDYEFLRLINISRYLPLNLKKNYDSLMFERSVRANLQVHRLIKIDSTGKCFKLTKRGRECLAEMGVEVIKDERRKLDEELFMRRFQNSLCNVVLTLAGIDIYYNSCRELADTDCGYVSSLCLRMDDAMKVLAGTKYLGILKLYDTSYVSYYVDESSWVYPGYEKDTYISQIQSVRNIKDIKIVLMGETLEELWRISTADFERTEVKKGMKPFCIALEEFGSEYLLVPLGRNGVLQMSVLKICRYRERISKAIGCIKSSVPSISECDGFIDDTPYIIAIDMNIKRIVRALKQLEKYNDKLVPRICCLSFQKGIILKLLKKYHPRKTIVTAIMKEDIYKIFPEIEESRLRKEPFIKTKGGYYDVIERVLPKDEFEEFDDEEDF